MSNPIPLLPCPFCGSTSAPSMRVDDETGLFLIRCGGGAGCGAQSFYGRSQDAAALLWNSRKPALDADKP